MKPRDQSVSGVKGYFQHFLHSEVSGSVVLLACTVLALIWANSPWAEAYEELLHTRLGFSWGSGEFSLTLHHWVNDGLMVVFFFVVGLEIKRELLVGELSSLKKSLLPVSAALGGMLVPAGFYALLNLSGEGAGGWGIPMATDIAFALGVLAVVGSRVPLGLKVFLTAVAIADDLGAVLVIALFYTDTIRITGLLVAAVFLVLLLLAVQFRIRRPGIQFLLIIGVWIGVFSSGVHATVAGILVALVVPVTARIDPGEFFRVAESRISALRDSGMSKASMIRDDSQLNSLLEMQDAVREMTPSGLVLEQSLHPVQAFLILPLFALFNAGVSFGGGQTESLLSDPVSLGVLLGLVLGKPIGILFFSWLATRLGWGALPEAVNWGQVAGVGCVAGIGFTMSLFVTELAFDSAPLIGSAKMGILAASAVSAVVGFMLLRFFTRPAGS